MFLFWDLDTYVLLPISMANTNKQIIFIYFHIISKYISYLYDQKIADINTILYK